MPVPKFSPRDVDRLKAMAAKGESGVTIGRALGRDALSIRKKAVALGVRLRPHRGDSQLRFAVSPQVYFEIVAASNARGVSPSRLCRHLVETVAKDKLFDAIIDPPPPAPPPSTKPDWWEHYRLRPSASSPRANVSLMKAHRITAGEVADIRTLAERGLCKWAIGKAIGRAAETVGRAAARAGIELPRDAPTRR
jgi:hypothetical protein